VADLVAYAHEAQEWTLYVSLDDSLGEQEKGTRHLEAVAYHHDHTKSQGKKTPSYTNGTGHIEVRFQLGARSYAYDWRLSLREKTVRCLNRQRAPQQRLGVTEADAAVVVTPLAEEPAPVADAPVAAPPISPLLPMTGRNGASSAPKTLLNSKQVRAARKEITP
jgi:hypothetical protein